MIGGLSFALEESNIGFGTLELYYPISVVLIAIGVYIVSRTVPLLDSHRLLAKNEEYISRLGFKLKKKVRKKVDGL